MNKAKVFLLLGGAGVIVLAGAIALVTVGKEVGQFFFGRSFAESELRSYVQRVMGEEVKGVQCQKRDSDGNGYVSCDYTLVSQPGKTYSLECSAWGLDGFLNRGCKTRLPSFN